MGKIKIATTEPFADFLQRILKIEASYRAKVLERAFKKKNPFSFKGEKINIPKI